MADQIDPRLLDRYVTGECTPAERIVVEAWIAGDPHRREMVDGLAAFRARLIARAQAPAAGPTVDAMHAALTARLAGDRPERGVLRFRPPEHPGEGAIRRWPRYAERPWLGAAAAVVLAVGLGYGVHVFGARRSASALAWREYGADAGERRSVTLSDGTQFTLAPESRLRVPADFAAGHRAVELEGEAFFAVVHDAAHPFSVRAGRVVTVDVGTSFDVRAYAGEQAVRIGVADGQVALTVLADTQVAPVRRPLVAGDLAEVGPSGTTTVSRGVEGDAFVAWMRGTLVFERAPLTDVTAELSRWYGVTFTSVDPALADVRLTATYERESLDEVLDQMGRVIGARIERHGRRIALRAAGVT